MMSSVDPQTATPLPLAQPRVLIVDDEAIVRAVMRMMLQHAGFATEEAGTAAEALKRVQSASIPFAVVLLDYTLPDRAGTAVIPDLRRLAPDSGIVLTSGRIEEDLPRHGEDSYLPKPFTKEQIVTAIRSDIAAVQR